MTRLLPAPMTLTHDHLANGQYPVQAPGADANPGDHITMHCKQQQHISTYAHILDMQTNILQTSTTMLLAITRSMFF